MNNKLKTISIISVVALAVSGMIYGAYRYRGILLKSLIDVENEKKLKELHPKYKQRFYNFIYDLNKKGYTVLITSGFRSFEKQQQLLKENPKAGKPGMSLHNYGIATDINIMKPEHLGMNSPNDKWKPIVDIAKKNGLDWGGELLPTFTTGGGDRVHFQPKNFKYKGSELLAMKNAGNVDKNEFVKIT